MDNWRIEQKNHPRVLLSIYRDRLNAVEREREGILYLRRQAEDTYKKQGPESQEFRRLLADLEGKDVLDRELEAEVEMLIRRINEESVRLEEMRREEDISSDV